MSRPFLWWRRRPAPDLIASLRVFCEGCRYHHSPGTLYCPSFHRHFGRTVEPGLPVARVVRSTTT